MNAETEDPASFSRWIARPQSLIALSAVLLSVCGVFIATYEATLVRRQQRASVWPHLEVAASMSRERVELWVKNVGIGPARVRTAAVSQGGETRKDWADLIRRAGVDPKEVGSYYSLINGRVLPLDSEREVIWRVTPNSGEFARRRISLAVPGSVESTSTTSRYSNSGSWTISRKRAATCGIDGIAADRLSRSNTVLSMSKLPTGPQAGGPSEEYRKEP